MSENAKSRRTCLKKRAAKGGGVLSKTGFFDPVLRYRNFDEKWGNWDKAYLAGLSKDQDDLSREMSVNIWFGRNCAAR